jgi:hypothetical protein
MQASHCFPNMRQGGEAGGCLPDEGVQRGAGEGTPLFWPAASRRI